MKSIRCAVRHRKQKSDDTKCLSRKLNKNFSPLHDFNKQVTNVYCKNSMVFKTQKYHSPNSYQNSELVSKKQSRQKINLKRKKDGQGTKLKMKKIKLDSTCTPNYRQLDKQNSYCNLSEIIAQNFKITRWKNKILKQFVLKPHQKETSKYTGINFLDKQIKIYTSQNSNRSSSKSFFGFLLSDYQEQSRKTSLIGSVRILTIDWMILISASLLLNRETVHLGIHYLDSYLSNKQENQDCIPVFAVAALLIAVKQEERQLQPDLLETACMSEKYSVLKEQVIQSEKKILRQLNFRLKSNTLAFWIDYFSQKWDSHIKTFQAQRSFNEAHLNTKIQLRTSDGDGYRLYRQMMELADIALMFGDYIVFEKSKLALACIYLVLRIETEKVETGETIDLFKNYHKLFQKKASPIFKDRLRINQIFNGFLTQICQFQITQIIPAIKYMANFLELNFSFQIDEKALDQTKSYEDFIRRVTYSEQMKECCMGKIF